MEGDLCEGEAEWEVVEREQMVRAALRSRQRPGQSPGAWSGETDWDTMAVVLGAPGAKAQEAERRSHGQAVDLTQVFRGDRVWLD